MNNNMQVIDEHRQYIAELRAQLAERDAAVQRWISANERLPDKPQKVLGLYRNQDGFWRYTITIYFSEIGSWSNQVDIRYWMPLPPPPTDA